ncbi:hypothetical protein PPERSA_09791 [Pseudocohnilembus persalinus]|uniref:Uncharacterized protein n=1 Tax=Pseudocohnilembus persalinus TaxID=266149 RepID=A0A0V0QTC8_PSEPJ|nr:hypothetical protein PPERSA_09791 [Pseudocohnilembus persalinus]|eukprot:KRX05651.1 hypothetical protein PPERSA_09791 [Pseudocohnilembus persalinus]
MAPPPKYLITRKLVRRFFDKHLPKQPLQASDPGQQLFQCWEKFGIDDARCKQYEVMYDHVFQQNTNYRQRVKNLRIREDVMETLKKPIYPNQLKGRYKKKNIATDIYNGLV